MDANNFRRSRPSESSTIPGMVMYSWEPRNSTVQPRHIDSSERIEVTPHERQHLTRHTPHFRHMHRIPSLATELNEALYRTYHGQADQTQAQSHQAYEQHQAEQLQQRQQRQRRQYHRHYRQQYEDLSQGRGADERHVGLAEFMTTRERRDSYAPSFDEWRRLMNNRLPRTAPTNINNNHIACNANGSITCNRRCNDSLAGRRSENHNACDMVRMGEYFFRRATTEDLSTRGRGSYIHEGAEDSDEAENNNMMPGNRYNNRLVRSRSGPGRCILCFEKLRRSADQDTLVLNCGHEFHQSCLKKWVEHSSHCVICNVVIDESLKTSLVGINQTSGGQLRNDYSSIRGEQYVPTQARSSTWGTPSRNEVGLSEYRQTLFRFPNPYPNETRRYRFAGLLPQAPSPMSIGDSDSNSDSDSRSHSNDNNSDSDDAGYCESDIDLDSPDSNETEFDNSTNNGNNGRYEAFNNSTTNASPFKEPSDDNAPSSYCGSSQDCAAARQERDSNTAEEVICAICLDDCKDDADTVALACSHQFHKACIRTWLRRQPACPLCKKAVTGQLLIDIIGASSAYDANENSQSEDNDSGSDDVSDIDPEALIRHIREQLNRIRIVFRPTSSLRLSSPSTASDRLPSITNSVSENSLLEETTEPTGQRHRRSSQMVVEDSNNEEISLANMILRMDEQNNESASPNTTSTLGEPPSPPLQMRHYATVLQFRRDQLRMQQEHLLRERQLLLRQRDHLRRQRDMLQRQGQQLRRHGNNI